MRKIFLIMLVGSIVLVSLPMKNWAIAPVCSPNTAPVANAGPDQTVTHAIPVMLNGNGSYDPDGDLLTYKWEIISKPVGSEVSLDYPDSVNPSFIPDLIGEYVFQLAVTDYHCLLSYSLTSFDQVIVSTTNTAPVADAGDDQTLTQIGSTVQLDGTGSSDFDGDTITYSWTWVSKPAGSSATLSGPSSWNPTFIADVHGDYKISLIVTDVFRASSPPDSVKISFTNVKPVADAGGDQSVEVGDIVVLDGGGSTDANNDPLTFKWSLVSSPPGSLTKLSNSTSVNPSFVPDLPGDYVVSLTVNDGLLSSEPDNVTIIAVSLEDMVIRLLRETIARINGFDKRVFKFKSMRKDLTGRIIYAIKMVDKGHYKGQHYRLALATLQYWILPKIDGCAEVGRPDEGFPKREYDWLITCEAQGQVYPLIQQAIKLLRDFL